MIIRVQSLMMIMMVYIMGSSHLREMAICGKAFRVRRPAFCLTMKRFFVFCPRAAYSEALTN